MPVQLREITGGTAPFVAGTFFDLATVGYEQAEYSMAGRARAFGRGGSDLSVVEEAEFTTRLLVYRPADLARFDGSVVVEWLNVSGGLDAAPVWLFTHRELVRRGAAWIGVSAQHVGVHGGASVIETVAGMSLVDVDPERYAGLHHPGDRFSYDIFTNVAAVARGGHGTVLDGLPVDRVLAVGESQSAYRLTTYVNDIDPAAEAYDGFLVHARGGTAAPLDDRGDPLQLREGPSVPFRDDLRAPVLCVEAETDLITLDYRAARQDDGDRLVVWEIAGTSHADVYTFVAGFADDGLQPIEDLARCWQPTRDVVGQRLDEPVNVGPQHYVVQAAVRALDAWVRDSARPRSAPPLELDGDGFARDAHGQRGRGGIRTPHVDVPVAVLSGLGNGGSPLAFLAGRTVPFTTEHLVARYGTKAAFVEEFTAAAEAAVRAGFLLAEDLSEVIAIAAANVEL